MDASIKRTEKPKNFMKYFKTTAIAVNNFSMGLIYAGLGPTLPTLAYNLRTDLSTISNIYMARGIGYLSGSAMSSFFLKRISPYFYLTIIATLISIALILAPYMQSVPLLAVILAIEGMSQGSLDTLGNVLILDLWRKHCGPFLQFVKLMFAIGGTFGPLIAAPFVRKVDVSDHAVGCSSGNFTENSTVIVEIGQNITAIENSKHMNVRWAFLIYSMFPALAAVLYLIISIKERFAKSKSKRQSTVAQEGTSFRVKILILLFLFFFLYLGFQSASIGYLYSFATSCEIGLDKNTAVGLNTLFMGSLASGRLLAVFIAMVLSPKKQMFANLIGAGTASCLLLIYSHMEEKPIWLLWIAIGILGISVATLFATCFAWAEQYITVTGTAATIMLFGGATGIMTLPLLVGRLVQKNPFTLIYFTVAFSVVEATIFGLLYKVSSAKGKRSKLLVKEFSEEEKEKSLEVNNNKSDLDLEISSKCPE